MPRRIIDLSLTIDDNMPAHMNFQRPVITTHFSHESSAPLNQGVPGDRMTFQTNFLAMIDHVGTHVDAFRHVNPKGAAVDEMPIDMFIGKAICLDMRHVPDLGDITERAPPRDNPLRNSESFPEARVLLAECVRLGNEGIVAKRKDAPYRSGRRSGRVKVTTEQWKVANRHRARLYEKI
jgi:kynurenine formamidase